MNKKKILLLSLLSFVMVQDVSASDDGRNKKIGLLVSGAAAIASAGYLTWRVFWPKSFKTVVSNVLVVSEDSEAPGGDFQPEEQDFWKLLQEENDKKLEKIATELNKPIEYDINISQEENEQIEIIHMQEISNQKESFKKNIARFVEETGIDFVDLVCAQQESNWECSYFSLWNVLLLMNSIQKQDVSYFEHMSNDILHTQFRDHVLHNFNPKVQSGQMVEDVTVQQMQKSLGLLSHVSDIQNINCSLAENITVISYIPDYAALYEKAANSDVDTIEQLSLFAVDYSWMEKIKAFHDHVGETTLGIIFTYAGYGHWIGLTLHKDADSKITVYHMNSLRSDTIKDKGWDNLIRILKRA